MGVVFEAEDSHLMRAVALKVMKRELAENPAVIKRDPAARQRFLREARAMAAVRSEHIVTIHQVGEQNGLPYMAMELLPGSSLDGWLGRGRQPSLTQILDIGLQIARGLEAAHRQNLIHRDIKPANLWLEEATGRVKVLDFGLARPIQEDASLTQTGIIMGTPAYMAPEQAEGLAVDGRCDLFSLGCVLYELAAGRPPFRGASALAVLKAAALHDPDPLSKLYPAVPPALESLINRLLSKNPSKRPASAREVVEALQDIAAARTSTEQALVSGSSLAPPVASAARLRKLLAGGALVVLALAFGGVLIGWQTGAFSGAGAAPGSGASEKDAAARIRPSTAPGVTNDEVLLGMTAPFSGGARDIGRELELGIQVCLRQVNDAGGVAGRRLTLLTLDDGYEPDRALENVKKLADERKVFAFIGNVGTSSAEKTLPYTLDKRMLFFCGFSGAPVLRRDPPDRYVFNYRASFEEETAAILQYLVDIRKIRPDQIAVFAQKDGYGDAGFRGVAKKMRKFGRDPEQVLRVGHPRNTAEINEAVDEIAKHKEIRAVILISTYRPASRFIQHIRDKRPDVVFANVSFGGSMSLAEELAQYGPQYMDGVIVTQVVPPIDSQSSAVLKFRELLAKYKPNEQPSFVSLEGYIDAAILAEGLRRAGDNLTTETLVSALESIQDFDLGLGSPIHYGPSEHQASHKVWGTVLDRSRRFNFLELE
jgi:ABC-type branched-subunit amino acid transport system substrate-binding protein